MSSASNTTVTDLLVAYNKGERDAIERLLPLVYDELRRIANSYLSREQPGHTLQPTALVHEAYLRLVDQNIAWENRSHFFRYCCAHNSSDTGGLGTEQKGRKVRVRRAAFVTR